MNNPLIDEVRAARAARAESLDYEPHKNAVWARAAHADRQIILESKHPEREATGSKHFDKIGQLAAAPSL